MELVRRKGFRIGGAAMQKLKNRQIFALAF